MRSRFRFTPAVGIALTTALLATALFAVTAPTALADPAAEPADVSQTVGNTATSGTVPDGTCRANVQAVGGGGGANYAYGSLGNPIEAIHRAGDGAAITVAYELHPGQAWTGTVGDGGAMVESGGQSPSGNGGDGGLEPGGRTTHAGGGGGGLTDFFIADLTTVAIAAGGGGGSGGGHFGGAADGIAMQGGDAGLPGGAGAAAAGTNGNQGNDDNGMPAGGAGGGVAGPGLGGLHPSGQSNGSAGVGTAGGGGGDAVAGSIDLGGGGGAGYFGGGGGAGTRTNGGSGTHNSAGLNYGGGGGGGGSSFVSATPVDGLGTVPVLVSAVEGTAAGLGGWGGSNNPATAPGAAGELLIDFVPCEYNLQVQKSGVPAAVLLGDTITWTVTVTNLGPDEMTRGDVVTLTDSLPGSGATNVVSVTHTPGAFSGLDQAAVTCNVAPGGAMAGTVTCSQPYAASAAVNVPAGGVRGLDVGGSIEIVYTQPANDLGCSTNTAGVTDRVNDGTATAEVCVADEVHYLELDKSVSAGPVNNQDGTYTLSYDITVTNPTSSPTCTGTGLAPDFCQLVDQTNVQVTDGLDATIASAATSISSSVTAGTCTDPTPAYDGVTNTNLLAGTDTIATGTSCTITVSLTVTADPDAGIGTVAVNAASTNTANVTSAEGATASATAEATFPENPSMVVSKSITDGPTSNQNGTYGLTYEVSALNNGDVELRDLQLTDGLQTIFGSALVSATASSTGCTDSADPYDGIANTDLLTGTDVLAVGATCTSTINVVVTVDSTVAGSAALNTDYTNTANGSATSPSNAAVGGSATDTTQFTENPSTTVEKTVGTPVNNQDGTYDIEYTLVMTNTGDVELRNVQLTDGLQAVWGGALLSASASTVGPCTDATTLPYDGVTNLNLWEGTDTMFAGVAGPPGDVCTVTITATVTADSTTAAPAALDTDYTNAASGGGTSPGGTAVSDGATATTQLMETPAMGVTKDLTGGPDNNEDGTYDVEYTITVANMGDVELRNVQASDGLLAVFGGALVSGTAAAPTGTGTCTAPATAYDGTTNLNLLAGTDTLGVGLTCQIVVSVVVTADSDGAAPAALNTDYVNTATGAGTSPGGEAVGGTDNATAQFTENPSVAVDKNVTAGPTNNEDGTYTIEYTIDVANDGDVELRDFQVDDGLLAVFGAGLASASAVSTAPCSDSAAPYDGVTNTNLLTGTDTLAVGDTCQIVITAIVTVDSTVAGAATLNTDYTNVAAGDGDSPAGTNATDSDDAVAQVTENPSIAVDKAITAGPTNNQDGTWSLTYQIDVANDGDVELRDVQVTDGLLAVFGAGLSSASASSTGACTDSAAPYDGITNTDLLVGTDTLNVGDVCVITIEVLVDVDSNDATMAQLDTPYGNTANGDGDSPAGTNVTDDGTASTMFTENPGISLTKAITAGPTNNMDGTYDLTYQIDIANTGDVSLLDVQVTDGLDAVFGNALVAAVASSTAPCTDSSAPYDGVTNVNLLEGTDTLPVAGTCTIVIDVTVTVDTDNPDAVALDTDFTNTANTDGDSPAGNNVSDDDTAVTQFNETPMFALAKAITDGPINNEDGTYTIEYTIDIENTGDVELRDVQVTDGLQAVWGGALVSSTGGVTAGACTTAATVPYDGITNVNLLEGADTMAVAATCTMVVTAVVSVDDALADPAALDTDYENTADGGGVSPGGEAVSASDTAVAQVSENPGVSIGKTRTDGPTNNEDGTWGVQYTLDIANTGDVELRDLQVQDGLFAVFGNAIVSATGTSTAPCTDSAAPYDGTTNIDLLTGTDTLPVGGTCSIVIDVLVTVDENDPDAAQLDVDYTNMAAVTGNSPSGAPQAAADTETTSLGENPAIGVTKDLVGDPVNNGDGTHTATYQIVVENTGDVELRNVQVTDGLEAVFGAGNIQLATATAAAPCTTNPSYTGVGLGVGLLAGTDTMAVGAVCGITVVITVEPGTNLGPHTNTADASGTSPGGEGVADDDPADVTFVENPAVEIVKSVSQQPVSNLDGSFDMSWEMVIENTGDIVLHNVQVTDDMAAALGTTLGWSVTGTSLAATDTCTLATAPVYTGTAPDTLLLDGTDSLVIGETCTITIDVTLEPGLALGPHTNTATVNGTSPGGAYVDDTASADVTVVENPAIDIVKTVKTEPVNDGTGVFTMVYEMTTTNTGDVPLYGVQVTDDLATAFAGVASWSEVASVTAGVCTINPNFDGDADMNLLVGLDTLTVNDFCTIEIEVTFDPEGQLGTYTNAAGTSGTSPGGEGVDDADSTDEAVEENPEISLTKDIVSPGIVNNQDFTYDLTYAFVVTNTGDVPLNGAQVTDDLTATFASATAFTVAPGAVSITAGACAANAVFDGSADINLLAGTDRLVVGESCTIEFTVTVTPGAELGVYDNTADATGTSPAGEGVTDVSQDGADADPDGDGDPSNNSDPTPATFPENPEISLTKDIIDPPAVVNNEDGTYTLTYRLVATNTGDVPLLNAQVVDDMSVTYASATAWSVAGTSQPNADACSLSATYDGSPDTALLSGTDTMMVGDVCTVDIEILVTPGADLGPYDNSATASGTSPGGEGVDDISQDGTDPDPDGDGDPSNNSDPTPAWFTEAPQISLAKSLIAGPTNNGDGTYSVTYQLDVANSGNIILYNVQVDDDMSVTYAPAISWSVDDSRVTAGACTAAATLPYDGAANVGTLEGADSMAVGDTCTIEIDVTFEPGSFLGAYENTATANGTSPAGDGVSDVSQDGGDADPEGNGPGDNSDPTVLSVTENPMIDLTKVTAAGPTNNMDGTYTLTWGLSVENTGDIELRNVQVTDDIAATLASATSWTLDSHAVTAGACVDSSTFDGMGDNGLLAGTDTMAIGDVCEMEITVTVTPGGTLGVYTNNADTAGTSPAGANVTDVDTEDTTFIENPLIDIEKDIIAGPTNDGTGTFTTVYSLAIANNGDVPLSNVQVTDDLATVYAGVASWTATSAVVAGSCTDNPTPFDGDAVQDLLSGADTMPVLTTCAMEVTVVFNPGGDLGDYVNTASVVGTSPAGMNVDDADDASGAAEENPQISLAKDITAGPVNNEDGTYSLTYSLVVINTGDVPLDNVQVDDDLAATFADATSWMVDAVAVTNGACTVAATTPYDGSTAIGTLEGTDTMAVADTCTIDIDVTVEPGADLGAYDNTATANGTSPAGEGVDDVSQDGADTDPDGDGDPGNNSDPTPVWFTEAPQISLTKDIIDGPINNQDGTYTLTYALVVANSGDVPLTDVQVDDDLTVTFTSASTFLVTPGSATVTAGDCTASATYNGATDIGLLAGTDTMAITDTCTVQFEVVVTPGAVLGVYDNTATATGTSPSGDGVDDISQDGADADPEGDGPGDNSDPTPVEFPENPEISLAKDIVAGPTNNENGSYSLTYGLVVTNTGDIVLSGVQVDDDLSATFASATSWIATAVRVTDGACTAASTTPFDGLAAIGTLEGADTLSVAESCTIEVDVTVVPGSVLGVYDNTATAGGTSPGGTDVTDISEDGAEADPDGDGDPSNNSTPTPASFPENPQIALTKDIVSGPVANGDGSHALTYALVVTNTGDVPLNAVQVEDDMSATYATASSWSVDGVSITDGGCTESGTYDGAADLGTLAGTDSLAVGDSCTIEVAVTVTPGADLGPYDNTAIADGTSPSGAGVSDVSQDGADPDPDGDGDPSNNSDPTPAWFTEEPLISLTKRLSAGPTSNGDGTYDLLYEMVVANIGNVPLSGVQVNDTLNVAFASATDWKPDGVSVTSGICTASTTYDGVDDTGLLSATDTLTPSDTCTISIKVIVTPGADLGPYENSATAGGASPAGSAVEDISQDGEDEDPDADNDPGNNSEPTPAEFPIDPVIGLTKDVSDGPTLISGSNYGVTYRLVVSNEGDTALDNTQVADDLATTFASADSWKMVSVTVADGDCTASSSFDGDSDTDTLSGDDTLAIGESCSIDIKVEVDVGTTDGSFDNSATATGEGPGGEPVTDVSQDGVDNDVDGDGDPSNDSVPTNVKMSGITPPPPPPPPAPAPAPVQAPPALLPFAAPLALTGVNTTRMLALAVALMAFGTTLVFGTRRRSDSDSAA